MCDSRDAPSPPVAAPAEPARQYICPVETVADLVNNLLLMDQSLPIYGAQGIEHQGRRRTITIPPTVSRERVKDSRWIGEGDELNAAIVWTRAPQPPRPGTAPLSDEQIETLLASPANLAWLVATKRERITLLIRAVERAHGIGPTTPTPKD